MKAVLAGIVAAALCIGTAAPSMAQGTNGAARAHAGKGPFEQMDTRGDGKVTWDEFLAFHTAMLKAHFQAASAKGEIKETWDQVLAKRTVELKTRFAAIDANSDGVITREEFHAYWKAHKESEPHPGAKPQGMTGAGPSPTVGN